MKKIISQCLLLLLGFGFAGMPVSIPRAAAQQGPASYTIQLKNLNAYSELLVIGNNIHHLFLGNPNPQFQSVYRFVSNEPLATLEQDLQNQYTYLEQDRTLATSAVVVDDPGFTSNAQDVDKEWALPKAGFDQAWAKITGSNSNVVAVIDTGIDETHQDLKSANFVPGYNFLTQQPITIGSNSDDNGHGTLVAGILGATPNNGLGIAGTNWQISIMPLKALDSAGQGDSTNLAQAIIWATDHGAQFINLSVGGIGFGQDTTLANSISYAFNKGVLLVAAAGNDSQTTGQSLDQNPVFPVCDDNNYNMVIGVAATDQNDQKASFSNYGHNCIDVSAPGKRILSTISIDPVTKKPSPNSYAYASGTSLAVPFVVGQAALIKALYPSATNIQIRDRIISTADPIDSLNLSQCGGGPCNGLIGSGRIDVPQSIQSAFSQPFSEGDLVKATDLGVIYEISGGQKRLVSPFVMQQRFASTTPKTALSGQLEAYPSGPFVTPLDGTLIKADDLPTVYMMQNGQKLPITSQVFTQRNLSFFSVNDLTEAEVTSWQTGNFLPPLDGTLVRGQKNPTVYWVVGQALHPINYNFYQQRGLNVFPVMIMPDPDIPSYPLGTAYIQ